MMRHVLVLVVVALLFGLPPSASAQQIITAREGDTILVEGTDRVRVVRRRTGHVQTIYNAAERWLLWMVDYPEPAQPDGDGGADWSHTFYDIAEWPLGERWSGRASIEQYSIAVEGPQGGIGLRTDQGLIQILPAMDRGGFRDPAALAVLTSMRAGSRLERGESFAVIEPRLIAEARRNARSSTQVTTSGGVTASMGMSVSSASSGVGRDAVSSDAPVRVGGDVRTPRKIVDVAPVMPAIARSARVFGTVIIEAVIGTDGRVTSARVLRSIPLLDQAALDAVRQWRYEPQMMNGQPISVVMTVTVPFDDR